MPHDIKYPFQWTLYLHPFLKKINGKNVIFIHIPKNAGTSIVQTLNLNQPIKKLSIRKHYTTKNILDVMKPKLWDNSISFCFIRNPWDRLYSHYCYKKRKQILPADIKIDSFKDWVRHLHNKKIITGNSQPQMEWITDVKGQIRVKHICRFENLQDDFSYIANLINPNKAWDLPHVNAAKIKSDYRQHYDDESAQWTQDIYHNDINQFNYKF